MTISDLLRKPKIKKFNFNNLIKKFNSNNLIKNPVILLISMDNRSCENLENILIDKFVNLNDDNEIFKKVNTSKKIVCMKKFDSKQLSKILTKRCDK